MFYSLCNAGTQVSGDRVEVYMEKQDFMSALAELTLPSHHHHDFISLGDNGKKESSRRDPSSEALKVAALHDYFGHKSVSGDFSTAVVSYPYTPSSQKGKGSGYYWAINILVDPLGYLQERSVSLIS